MTESRTHPDYVPWRFRSSHMAV